MRSRIVSWLHGRSRWLVFTVLIAAPALALGLLGLRAIRADRIERDQRSSEARQQLAAILDAALRNSTVGLRQNLSGGNSTAVGGSLFQFGEEMVVFPAEKTYFAEFGVPTAARERTVSSSHVQLAEDAQAAEARGNSSAAMGAYMRLVDSSDLGGWARWQLAKLRFERGNPDMLAILADPHLADSEALTASGLPLPLVAATYVENAPLGQRARFAPLARLALDRLVAGSWWLSYDQRAFYHSELKRGLASAGVPAPDDTDQRAAELARLARLIRNIGPRTLAAGGPVAVQAGGAECVIISEQWASRLGWVLGAVFCGRELQALVDKAVRPVLGMMPAAVRDTQTGIMVWGKLPALKIAVTPLSLIPGWQLITTQPEDMRSEIVSYGFIGLLFALLLLGILMTGQVQRREVELARQQADFMASVTHEFKTPLTSIRLRLERLISRRVGEGSAVAEYYTAMDQQAERLEGMVNRMLEAHRIRCGSKVYKFVPCSAIDLVADSLSHLRTHAEAKRIRIQVEPAHDIPQLHADRDALREAIDNLIDNAIRYSPSETEIRVAVTGAQSQVRIDVRDQGIGIDPEDLSRIFDRFYRGKRGDRFNVQGTGLGLVLVKATAEAHGGSVQVQSKPGEGTMFSLLVPLNTELGEAGRHAE